MTWMLWLLIGLVFAAVIAGGIWTIVVWALSDLPVGTTFLGIKKLERHPDHEEDRSL